MEIIISKRFRKQAKKLVQNRKNLKEKLNECLIDLQSNGKGCSSYRKPLKGDWYGYDELELGGDLRIIARFHLKQERVVLEQVGTHAQLGW